MDVLITGAGGTVGTALANRLSNEEYDLTLLDVEEVDAPGESVVADVSDYDAIRPHFDGKDAVVHLAWIQESGGFVSTSRDIAWSSDLQANLEATNNVYEAARDACVESVVFASSHHAVGMVEVQNKPEVYHDEGIVVGHDEPHRPDSLYGVWKSYGEDLGRLAAEAHDIRFYGLRIGAVRDPQYDHPYGDAERGVEEGRWERGSEAYEEQVARLKAIWLSRRDLAHLVDCCLQDDTVEWDHFYGVSANDRRWIDDLAYAQDTIGYEPQDNGEAWDAPPEST